MSRLRPRWTLRTRLTALYAVVFLAAAAAFLIIDLNATNQSLLASLRAAKIASQFNSAVDKALPKPGLSTPTDAELVKQKLQSANRNSIDTVRADALANLRDRSLLVLAVLVPLTALAGWLLAGRALRPVAAITESARRASENQLSDRLALRGPRDEITELGDTFDAMLDRLEHAFDAQRRFTADASHELHTPLTVARTTIEVVLAKPQRTPEQLEEMARDVHDALGRAEHLLESLLTLTRSRHLVHRREQVDLATLAEDALDLHASQLATRPTTVDTELAAAPAIGDPALLERLVCNLVDNAARHNVPGGWVTVRTGHDAGCAYLIVANTGPALEPALVATLFEPFQRMGGRARSADGGLGLGLAIVRSVAEVHGGEVEAEANPDGGLIVTLRLPDID